MQRHAGALAAVTAILALALAFGPSYLRHGVSALLTFQSAAASSPYSIEVTPGNTKVPRGADQPVSATLVGFTSNDVSVMMRTVPSAPFERVVGVRLPSYVSLSYTYHFRARQTH